MPLEDIVSEPYLDMIRDFLDKNGYNREEKCDSIESREGNYHIFDIPRQMVICGKNKMDGFISFLKENNLVGRGFKDRIGLTWIDLK